MSTPGSSDLVSPTVAPYPPSTDYISDDLRSAKIMRWLRPELGNVVLYKKRPDNPRHLVGGAQPSPTCAVCEPTSVRATNPFLRRVSSPVARRHSASMT